MINFGFSSEKEKYYNMYSSEDQTLGYHFEKIHGQGYGQGFWGLGVLSFFQAENPISVLDIGCGYGKFCDALTHFVPTVYGLDIASVLSNKVIPNRKINFIDGEAKNIPLKDKSVEWVTSFDCLEHCPENDIDAIFEEFNRVSKKGFVISVSDIYDYHLEVELHLTVHPQEWWKNKLMKYGTLTEYGQVPETRQPYIIVRK